MTKELQLDVQNFNIQGKKKVELGTASFKDCALEDGLNLDLRFVTGHNAHIPTLRLPKDIQDLEIELPDTLCNHLEILEEVWSFNHKAMCRSKIDAILANALYTFGYKMHAFGEVTNAWNGPGVYYNGRVDYMIGSGQPEDHSIQDIDSFIIVVEAQLDWPAEAVSQTLAEVGCVLRNRLQAGKNTPVFAILTNSKFFRFFAIDVDGVAYSSGVEMILFRGYSWKANDSLIKIWKWFYWFITCMKSISPRCSEIDITEDTIKTNTDKIIENFGPI